MELIYVEMVGAGNRDQLSVTLIFMSRELVEKTRDLGVVDTL